MECTKSRKLLTARPRGFCAGVERAIAVVDRLLEVEGLPLHVRREIVHNKSVAADFRERGVVFVAELDQVPEGATVVFSAHGVSPAVREQADRRHLRVIDATCPLVSKVHREVLRNASAGYHTFLIGHEGHDEVLGTLGEAPGNITLITDTHDAAAVGLPGKTQLCYVTQTTLSADETTEIGDVLRRRFPDLRGPELSDICFATQNRQDAVKELVKRGIDYLLVVGSANSSNSRRLCEVAERRDVPATLIDGVADLSPGDFEGSRIVGLTAGASAPERIVREVIQVFEAHGWQTEELDFVAENVHFPLPPEIVELGD